MKQIEYFLIICEKGSFTAAASSVYISQQAMSASMSHLEEELGCRLFHRSSNGIRLTPEGTYFRGQAEKMLALDKSTKQYLAGFHTSVPNLIVGCAYGVIGELSDKLLNKRELAQRGLGLKIVEYPDLDCEQAVLDGTVDVGLAIGPVSRELFRADFLTSRSYTFLVNKNHPLAKAETITIHQLQNENIIMMTDRFKSHRILDMLCKKRGISLSYAYECGEIAPIHSLVLQQNAIGIRTDFVFKEMTTTELDVLYLNEPDYVWAIYLISNRNMEPTQLVESFREYMLSPE